MRHQITFPDLRRRPPRDFRVRLRGFVILAQMLDKGRATLAGKNGNYNYNSAADQPLVRFLGFNPEAMLTELAAGKDDGEMVKWLQSHSKTPRAPWEIEAWSAFMGKHRSEREIETLALFSDYLDQYAKTREDIQTWYEIQRVRRAVTRSQSPTLAIF